MPRISTDQSTILQAVVTRLIGEIADLNAANCYESAEPDPTVERSHNFFVQVSIGDGQFPQHFQVGGGINQVTEEASVWVTAFSRIKTDQAQHAKQLLTDSSRGLLVLKKQILAALAGHDLQDAAGNEILRNYMAVVGAARPIHQWEEFSAISISFSTDFDWDLVPTPPP